MLDLLRCNRWSSQDEIKNTESHFTSEAYLSSPGLGKYSVLRLLVTISINSGWRIRPRVGLDVNDGVVALVPMQLQNGVR